MVDRPERERIEPRFSINSLSEYMVATATRRAAIIRNQKRPPDFLVARYTDAEDAIINYLTCGERDLDLVYGAQDVLLGKIGSASTEWESQRLQLCHDALGSFAEHIDAFDLEGAVISDQVERPSKLSLSGVDISVRPELGFLFEARTGPQSGLIKLYFRKNEPLTEVQAQYIGAALYYWGTTVAPQNQALRPARCMVYDIFAGVSFEGPRAHKRRISDLEAACEEIALRWSHV